ncbi:FG-GAP-like repeat-containing protein [Aquimarina sp. MMG016]|uniref:FG-GAP-like repeat-containing protein n=1 Tax=Aquimarina sp. MMG016 TaxID=2822690 RepID=UPI001B3A2D1F|nr:FG-GAP-like repeat-containing protein [Aquimarina sp. MMG016]MBQ4820615.1 VCBS repeat-containing protein [Aquimarina sp. MMG016]
MKKLLLFSVLLISCYAYTQTFAELATANLTGVAQSSVAWGDYDNDGDLDVLLTGWAAGSMRVSKIYTNTAGTFTELATANLTGVNDSAVAWGDYDNDGDLDILLTGWAGSMRVSKIYTNTAGTFTELATANLTGVNISAVAWGDYDNDGDLDVLLTGWTGSIRVSKIYTNTAGTFTELTTANLTGVTDGAVAWGDYDNDGDLDILLTGSIGSTKVSKIYTNTAGTFTELATASLAQVSFSSVAWGDYDNDGDADILLTGKEGSTSISKIYTNTAGTFTELATANLTGVNVGAALWGDYDNDGDLDILLNGWTPSGNISKIYTNTAGVFSELATANLSGATFGDSAWGDYDNDGDLDILLTGEFPVTSKIFTNNTVTPNTAPAAPTNPTAVVNGDEVTLSWTASTDNETPSSGLSYNVYIKDVSASSAYEVSPMAQENDGWRKLPALGNAQQNTSYTYKRPLGGCNTNTNFTFKVQAIDHSFTGSVFSTEGSFSIGDTTKPTIITQDITVQLDASGTITITPAQIDNGSSDNCGIQSMSLDTTTFNSTNIGTNTVTLTVTDVNGNSDSKTATVTVQNIFTEDTTINMPGAYNGDVTWGDYDNDGDLDLLLTGKKSISGVPDPITKLYTNNGGVFTEVTSANLTPVQWAAVDWGDYDNDGDLDLLLTGLTFGNINVTKIYTNDNGTFTELTTANLPGISYGDAAWGDYDNDGDLDIALTGSGISKIYTNTNGAFKELSTANLSGVSASALAWGDYDNDGDLDLLLTGSLGGTTPVSKIYTNTEGSFTELTSAGLVGVYNSAVAWGDYDNDGDLDIVLSGLMGSFSISKIYTNTGGNFAELTDLPRTQEGSLAWGDYDSDGDLDILISGSLRTEIYVNTAGVFTQLLVKNLPQIAGSDATWGDYDNDGDLDIALTGFATTSLVSKIFTNNSSIANTAPTAPTNPTAVVNGNEVTLSWTASTDTETPNNGLSYNVYIKDASASSAYEVTPMAQENDGWRKLPAIGNSGQGTNYTYKFPAACVANYMFKVQAIDHNFAGSAFSAEGSFSTVDTTNPTVVTQNITVQLDAIGTITITPAQIDNGSSDNCGIQSMSLDATITATTITFDCTHIGTNTVTLTVTDVNGNSDSQTAIVTVEDNAPPVFPYTAGEGTMAKPFVSLAPEEIGGVPSGVYYFAFDGITFRGALDVDSAGRSWLMILNYVHQGGVNTDLDVKNTDVPLLGSSTLGDHEGGTVNWGHIGNTLAATLDFSEMRFYGETSGHSRILSFTTDYISALNHVKTGMGTFDGIENNFTALANHTANHPGDAVNDFPNLGDYALTEYPFYRSGSAGWGIRGRGFRWEMDDFTNHGDNNTIHRVWARGDLSPSETIESTFVTVILDATNQATVAPGDFGLTIQESCLNSLTLSKTDFNCNDIGYNTVQLTATDISNNNTTIDVTVIVKEFVPPVANCVAPFTVQLDATGKATISASDINNGSTDNCQIASTSIDITDFNCTHVGANTVTLTVTDTSGNINTCTTVVTVEDTIAPTIICQNITVALDITGNATITPDQIDNGSIDNCGIATITLSKDTFDCTNVGTNTVSLIVTDVNGNSNSCDSTVTIVDTIPPLFPSAWGTGTQTDPFTTISQDVLKNVPSGRYYFNFNNSTFLAELDNDTDGGGWLLVLNYVRAAGENPDVEIRNLSLPLINSSTLGDNEVGTANWGHIGNTLASAINFNELRFYAKTTGHNREIHFKTEYTNAINYVKTGTGNFHGMNNGNFTALAGHTSNLPQSMNGGYSDQADLALTSFPFFRGNAYHWGIKGAGRRWEVDDFSINAESTIHSVWIRSNETLSFTAPVVTIGLDATGNVTLTPSDYNLTPIENCGGTIIQTLSKENFDCTEIGEHILQLTATDASGNSSTIDVKVIIEDKLAPTVITQDITVQLDASGTVSITAAQIDNGSSDNCGIQSMSSDTTSFDCTNVGANTVTLTITDVNGNSASNTATVTVEDKVSPTVITQDITVQLDATGNVNITPAQIDNSSSDNCGIQSMSLDITSFDCSNIGTSTVTLTVTDVNGNADSQTATVTVEDKINPTVITQNITVQLDATGNLNITPAQIDNGSSDNCGIQSMSLDITSFDCTNVGANTVTLTVTDVNGNSDSQTATVTVEDKINPTVVAQDITVQLDATGNVNITPAQIDNGSSDNCGIQSMSLDITSFDCNDVGTNTVSLTVTDVNGNSDTKTATITVEDKVVPTVITQNITIQLDATGNVSITNTQIDNGSSDNCGIQSMSLDTASFDCTNVGANTVTLTVTDINGNSDTKTATVTVEDKVVPTVITQNITVQLDATGNVSITNTQIDNGSSDNCGIQSMSIDTASFDCTNVGVNTVTLTVTDVNGNSDSQTAIVTVEDIIVPTVITQNITVQLDASGNISIIPAQIDNGSSDNCGIQSMSLDITSFDCTNVGLNTVNFTVTDVNGNSDTKTATVTVEDTVVPIVVTQDITVQLDAAGNASITLAQINNGSSDNCAIQSMSLDTTSFDCTNVGVNTVILTVTDVNGNSASNTAMVTVEDKVTPTVVTQNITVQLDASGNASITPAQIDNGSLDNCGIELMSLDITSFDCTNIGTNTVMLTVTDVNGNSDTKTATVTVQDIIQPVVVCQDITIQLDATGNATIAPADIDNGSSDACGVVLTLSRTQFSLVDVGVQTVTLIGTDPSGNTNRCTALVTVEDNIPPIITLIGDDPQTIVKGSGYVELGAITDDGSEVIIDSSDFIDATGTYYITYNATDRNGNNAEEIVRTVIVTNPNPILEVFPNPASDYIRVLNFESLEGIEMYDMTGKKIHRFNQQQLQEDIKVDHLPNGIYWLKGYFFSNGSVYKKIMIKH